MERLPGRSPPPRLLSTDAQRHVESHQRKRPAKRPRLAATQLISIGEAPRPGDMDPAELAAWTVIGDVLLNLDETITKGWAGSFLPARRPAGSVNPRLNILAPREHQE